MTPSSTDSARTSTATSADPAPAPALASDEDLPVVVVTGGSGLLGSRLIRALHDRYRMVSLDLDGDPRSPADVEFICTDITSDASVERASERIRHLYGDRIASVVHLAAYYDFGGAPSPLYEDVTVEGTRRLLRFLGSVDQFVFSSTMLVHEPTEPGEPIDEQTPLDDDPWPYPESKIDTEAIVDHEAGDTPTVVVRLAGVYDEDGHSPPLTNQIRRIHGHWPTSHFYPADLDRGQAFVHLDDAVDSLVRIVDRRSDLPRRFDVLVGEPETLGYAELQDLIAHELHDSSDGWSTWRVPKILARLGARVRQANPLLEDPFVKPWMVGHASDHYELDISTATDVLGWTPRHRVADVIPEMVSRLRQDPDAWYQENGLSTPRLADLIERVRVADQDPELDAVA